MSIFNINEKKIIVTGANQGNGLAIANGLHDAGAFVIGLDIKITENTKFISREIDLTDLKSTREIFSIVSSEFGEITGLVNNAGISLEMDKEYFDIQIYERTLNINLKAAFNLTTLFCEALKDKKGGSVVNITSLGAELGFPSNPSYQISKAALRQLSKSFAYDWSKYNIRFNNICPGYIKTSMTKKSFDDPKLNKERKEKTLLDRWGNPSDLIGASIFLLSEASSYTTGSTIYVDGGWTTKGI
tara:strand:+ start:3156 stop:3887 length:732 start_codon:yes stop_codon:yes gene_type:complete